MDKLNESKWRRGKNNTLRHYIKKLPWKVRRHNCESYLPNYFDAMIGDKNEITIAELGSGMFCTIGSMSKTAKIKIYASDILAPEFNQILKEHNITPIIPVVMEDMENLTYPDNFFDIAHCCNALDHTLDPIKAIKEMYRIVKPGGYIYLRHFVNVGEHEKYWGLHAWNIDMQGKDCAIWNKQEKFLLSEYFEGFTTVKKRELEIENDDMVVSILHKV